MEKRVGRDTSTLGLRMEKISALKLKGGSNALHQEKESKKSNHQRQKKILLR